MNPTRARLGTKRAITMKILTMKHLHLAVMAAILGTCVAFADGPVPNKSRPTMSSEKLADLIAIETRLQKVLDRARRATGLVDGSGSGVIISDDGYVLTAAHVNGRPGQEISIRLQDGSRVTGETLGSFRLADAGLIRIKEPGHYDYVSMGDHDTLKAGEWCFALGHPGGWQSERGVVLRLGKILATGRHMMMTDCKLLGGDSGGPLFDLEGNVIGIHSRIGEDVEENYHASIGAFRTHWNALVEGRVFPERFARNGGFLGVKTESIPEGAIVREVIENSAAQAAALHIGDIITHIDDEPLDDQWALSRLIGRHVPGTEVVLRIRRDGNEDTVKAVLGARIDD